MSKREKVLWLLFIMGIVGGLGGAFSQEDELVEKAKLKAMEKGKISQKYISKNQSLILEKETKYPIQSRDHIKPGVKAEKYTTNPPTSGAHENAEKGGFYPKGLVDEKGVHNLEHGYIGISYKNISELEIKDLEELSEKYLGSVIVSKREENDFDGIALTSWGNLMKIKKFDQIIIEDFIKRNKNKSPEKIAR